ncbi:hypothetical protein DCS_00181 [Drechmeria coniospora]|uniref:Integral membrane protein n=1 Tax=Drechmeria coniospora TaxID=98403 RepID=A0A151GPM1_DRECN|nr:hypothetical protein DCS_00181 [Drechmeria coniospora]KYK59054.1 hypothetical protein DCS_00181 [Drechmeria coniospora]ODA77817.1 hypothetical protein RJ55_06419 [Drechmeria coniospora]
MAQLPVTTIPPFSDPSRLPDCAKQCGPLYDANGACVPPAVAPANAGSYVACFCAHDKVSPFSQGTAGVCDEACNGVNGGLQSVAAWFQGMCATPKTTTARASNPKTTTISGSKPTSAASASANSNSGGGDWISNHWQWVIFIVLLVVGITVIWVGACLWRRRYIRKKDRQQFMGQKHSGSSSHPSWGPTVTGSESVMPMTFNPDAETGAMTEKPQPTKEKTKWFSSRRT